MQGCRAVHRGPDSRWRQFSAGPAGSVARRDGCSTAMQRVRGETPSGAELGPGQRRSLESLREPSRRPLVRGARSHEMRPAARAIGREAAARRYFRRRAGTVSRRPAAVRRDGARTIADVRIVEPVEGADLNQAGAIDAVGSRRFTQVLERALAAGRTERFSIGGYRFSSDA